MHIFLHCHAVAIIVQIAQSEIEREWNEAEWGDLRNFYTIFFLLAKEDIQWLWWDFFNGLKLIFVPLKWFNCVLRGEIKFSIMFSCDGLAERFEKYKRGKKVFFSISKYLASGDERRWASLVCLSAVMNEFKKRNINFSRYPAASRSSNDNCKCERRGEWSTTNDKLQIMGFFDSPLTRSEIKPREIDGKSSMASSEEYLRDLNSLLGLTQFI